VRHDATGRVLAPRVRVAVLAAAQRRRGGAAGGRATVHIVLHVTPTLHPDAIPNDEFQWSVAVVVRCFLLQFLLAVVGRALPGPAASKPPRGEHGHHSITWQNDCTPR